MPIIGIQRRLAEVGRIRIGEQVAMTTKAGKAAKRPKRLETFRLTSANHRALSALADTYGGSVVPWEDAPVGNQFELYTKAEELSVIVPPENMAFSQYFEVWSGGGCKVRCDGAWDTVNDEPCSCDPEKRLCKPHTRLSVMIAEVATSGMWRLDTQGYYAASELGGAFDLAQVMSEATSHKVLRGTLRLDQREVKRPDEPTRQFAVPVLQFDLEAPLGGLTPIGPSAPGGVLGAIAAIEGDTERPTRRNAAERVPSTGLRPGGGLTVHESDDEMGDAITPEMFDNVRRAFAVLAEWDREDVTKKWEELGLPMDTHAWTMRQSEQALGIVDAALNAVTTIKKPEGLKPAKATKAKIARLNILYGEAGIVKDREAVHAHAARLLGLEEVASLNDLTKAQVQFLIDQLEEDVRAGSERPF